MHMASPMTDHLEFHLGDRMRKAREIAGFGTRAQAFAELIGISRDTLRFYESGKTRPKAPVLRSWAEATGVSLQTLIGPDGDGPDGGNVVDLSTARDQGISQTGCIADDLHEAAVYAFPVAA